jgi:hypothetical protein
MSFATPVMLSHADIDILMRTRLTHAMLRVTHHARYGFAHAMLTPSLLMFIFLICDVCSARR